jgi:hypothetical protein
VSRTSLLAHEGSIEMVLPSGFLRMVERQLVMCFEKFIQGDSSTSVELHRETLEKVQPHWKIIRSDGTCLVCLSRQPQYGLPCGHSVCETCVRIFADCHNTNPWTFKINSCFLCRLKFPEIFVKVKPDTAGVRVLLIDGGGVRGIFPLTILKLLNDRLGLPYPIQENFDGAFGISSGRSLHDYMQAQ